MGKNEKKAMKAELGTMAGMVRMAEASAYRAEQRAGKAQAEWVSALSFATKLREQAEAAHTAAKAEAQARHGE